MVHTNDTRVLILAPTGRDAELSCAFLGNAGIHAQPCRDMSELAHEAERGCGAVVVAEETLSTSSVLALKDLLSKQPFWSDLPITIIATGGNGNRDTSRRLAVFGSVGNVSILERPFRPETLVNSLQVALRSRQRQYEVRELVKALGESEGRYRDLATTLEAQVKARTAALEETNRELEAFTYTIAHDLRAPLRAQQSFADALLHDFGDLLGETGRDYARRISDSAVRLNDLLQDLLAYSRLSRAEMKVEMMELRPLILRIRDEMDFEILGCGAKVNVRDFAFMVCGNESMLSLAITNLLSNAIKFSRPGVPAEIDISADERDGWVHLCVRDNGIGIDPEHHQQVFGIFNRLHRAGEYPGTGVGLAIVQRAVERMEGRVGVESQKGDGSRFWIELRKSC
ncbi:MAG: sensor histidine kinase [Limisphaerales bacterium]